MDSERRGIHLSGIYRSVLILHILAHKSADCSRHAHSCLPVSKCGDLREDHPPRLVEYVHIPHGKQSFVRRKG